MRLSFSLIPVAATPPCIQQPAAQQGRHSAGQPWLSTPAVLAVDWTESSTSCIRTNTEPPAVTGLPAPLRPCLAQPLTHGALLPTSPLQVSRWGAGMQITARRTVHAAHAPGRRNAGCKPPHLATWTRTHLGEAASGQVRLQQRWVDALQCAAAVGLVQLRALPAGRRTGSAGV